METRCLESKGTCKSWLPPPQLTHLRLLLKDEMSDFARRDGKAHLREQRDSGMATQGLTDRVVAVASIPPKNSVRLTEIALCALNPTLTATAA